jgi:hypothetical protein
MTHPPGSTPSSPAGMPALHLAKPTRPDREPGRASIEIGVPVLKTIKDGIALAHKLMPDHE